MNLLLAILSALPELIKLFIELERKAKQSEQEVKAKEQVKQLRQALKDRDAKAIGRIMGDVNE